MNVCEYSPLLCGYHSLGINYRATIEKLRTGEIRALFFEVIPLNSQKNKTKSRTADSLVYEVIIYSSFAPYLAPCRGWKVEKLGDKRFYRVYP